MKCNVTINNGKAGTFTSRGELNLGVKGFGLFYETDGDKCVLTYANGVLTQERFGGVQLKMIFAQGKETECTLGEGGLSGTFNVYTDKIYIVNDDRSVTVTLTYVCAGESVTLQIIADSRK